LKKTASAFTWLFLAVLCYGQNFSRGEEFFMQNKPSEALIYLENAVVDDPADTMASLYLGIVYEQLDRADEAIAIYRRALPIAGKLSANFSNNLGNVYFQKGNTELAEQYYTQALASDVVFSRAYLGRANTRIKAGDLQNAVSDYEQYLTLEPRSPQRSRIEQVIAMIRAEFAAEERRRLIAEEAERVRAEERQRLLNDVSSSLQSAADSSQGMSFGAEDIEGYDAEFELE
jgi:Tfp pilus assembly protein PilF